LATYSHSGATTPPSGWQLQVVRRDPEFVLYRGQREADGAPVLLLTLASQHPGSESLGRLEHEYRLKDELAPEWAVRALEIVWQDGRPMLVLADPGGEFLDRLIRQPMELTEFLHIAITLSATLARLHACGLIHKDLKPANILVDTETWAVRLTGFGIASRLPRERQAPAPPEVIAGTLAYMAPEQTGRMNRSIDARSDLYSLGVILYEVLTGVLPFAAADPLEWVHCHIARQPLPPHERVNSIPEPVSAIVMKLLAKTAEERYQTAAGLQADLRRCLTEWESQGEIAPFPLGMQDASDRLLIPEKLYGRESEIAVLLDAFDRVVASGTAELVLVSGYSGIGKSSVVNELHKALVLRRGLFAAGKFDQYKRDIPYTTLAQAFQTVVRQILCKSDAEVSHWRDALQEALGVNGQLIVDLVPEIELVIGRQPPTADLPPQDAQRRFQMVFRHFLGVFTRPEHPLTLFLDDLQWLDAATLAVLEDLLTYSELQHLLLIGAYRDNEVSPSHPLMRTLETLRMSGARVEEIVLSPLALADVARLVADSLHCERQRAQPLAKLVYEKAGGNPFFAIQFLTVLAEERLLAFAPASATWIWDLERIRGKGFTDNVADLMTGKLKRLPITTQEALQQLACLGNVAEIATLTLIHDKSEEEIHTALWDAARIGLIYCHDGFYVFLHDRIQEAAYALVPEGERAVAHLRIGRLLAARTAPEELEEKIFEIVNQFNRGAAPLLDRDEKTQVATLDLRAGRKAKASAAYASACAYLAAGMALLDETGWGSQYELMFSLWLERAECEFLTGNLEQAEQLIAVLLQRAASKVDQAAVYRLKVLLHIVKFENPQAVDSALACLRLFGIDIPSHPPWEEVQAEYETVWRNLDGRPIESLIDLPLMTDPELQAAMRLLLVLTSAAYYTDFHLFCLLLCRIVNVSMQHGTSGVAAHACGYLGFTLGPLFHRYREGYRFAKLACDLVEKHGFIAYEAKVYLAMGLVAVWTQPITSAIDFYRAAFRTAIETGDLTFACYGMIHFVAGLLTRNDPLDAVWRESEIALDFARKAKFRAMADHIVYQQRFIATLQGRTRTFSTFSDAQFDESALEAHLTGEGVTARVAYWIIKLQARFLAGDYVAALAAAQQAKPLLGAIVGQANLLDYFYYSALTVAALYKNASADEQTGWHEVLTAHQEQLREWAENYPPTFCDKHALVSAEIARLEERAFDAMQLYEQAIQSAHENGFVQNEAVALEVAARFYATHGFEAIAHTYLRNARNCYDRWGALGKVKQLEESYPQLHEERLPASTTSTIGTPVRHLDVETVVKASQALSSEIVLSKLIEKLMRIAVEHAGAERGLLILLRGDEPEIEAEVTTGHGTVEVTLRQAAITPAELPASLLHYVVRTRENVILDDASVGNMFSEDEYVQQRLPRSVLCLPIVKQAKIIGALYLENNLTPRAFTSNRVALLELLASQAAISLENAALYAELRRSEAFLAEGQSITHTGTWSWNIPTGKLVWSEEQYRIFGFDPEEEPQPTFQLFWERVHSEDRPQVQQTLDRAIHERSGFSYEFRIVLPDGSIKYLHGVGRPVVNGAGEVDEYIGTNMDITARKRAEEALRSTQAELARVARLTMMGELAASIAHEINQPLAAIVMNGSAGLRWLNKSEPDVEEARNAFSRIVSEGKRAGDVIRSLRALVKKSGPEVAKFDINDAIQEVLALTRSEVQRQEVSVHTALFPDHLFVMGDRVQLQQVLLNLIKNAAEAMSAITDRAKMLEIRGQITEAGEALITVEDTGTGLDPATADHILEPFFTTKSSGMGMGLSICRSIIEAHGGRLWASPRSPHGTAFQFTVPTADQ
jgi:PAS domain S-box-containing protein